MLNLFLIFILTSVVNKLFRGYFITLKYDQLLVTQLYLTAAGIETNFKIQVPVANLTGKCSTIVNYSSRVTRRQFQSLQHQSRNLLFQNIYKIGQCCTQQLELLKKFVRSNDYGIPYSRLKSKMARPLQRSQSNVTTFYLLALLMGCGWQNDQLCGSAEIKTYIRFTAFIDVVHSRFGLWQ